VSAEWSSAPCTAAEVELIVHLGPLDMEGNLGWRRGSIWTTNGNKNTE